MTNHIYVYIIEFAKNYEKRMQRMAKKIKDEHGNVYVQKKPFYQRWWFISLVVLVVVGGFGGNKASKESSQADNTAEIVQTKEEAKETAESAKEAKTEQIYGIGQVVKVGEVEYTVQAKSSATNVGGDFGKNANGVYLILDVVVKNVGSKAITVDANFFTLYRGDVEYSSDSAAGIYANDQANFFLSEVNPGTEIVGKVVFDVPQEVIDDTTTQLQVQTGVWGTQKARINLQ